MRRGIPILTAAAALAAIALLLTAASATAVGGTLVGGATPAYAFRDPPPRPPAGSPAKPYPVHQSVTPSGFAYRFWNWDFDEGANHVDNPVTIIFVSDQDHLVDHVYTGVQAAGLKASGAPMLLRGVGGSRPGVSSTDHWGSTSHGRKEEKEYKGCWGQCQPYTDIHLRIYGPNGSRGTQVYQGGLGSWGDYYAPATVHFDVKEGEPDQHFGYQGRARELLVGHMVQLHKWTKLGQVSVGNSCYEWFDHEHYCDSDGMAWVVRVNSE
jgi:hypothetical protein